MQNFEFIILNLAFYISSEKVGLEPTTQRLTAACSTD
jgi:hypothetical protein